MKKFFLIFLIVFTNVFFLIFLLFITDFITYRYYANIFKNDKYYKVNDFGYYNKLPFYITNLKDFFNGSNNIYMGRKPDGLKYKNKIPVIVFGCSFAYGEYLNYNQTFSYKLANILKRPVHNRAIIGGSFQHMYFQTADYGNKELFNDIKDSDTVIYIMINDHYRRIMLNYFNILDKEIQLTYSYNNGTFHINNNKFINLLKSSYTIKNLNHIYAYNYVINPKHAEILTDIVVSYFEQSRKKLEEHYNKPIKFYILLYDTWDIPYKSLLQKKLTDKEFFVISTKDLTDEDLLSSEYMMPDNMHPTEAAWDLLTPKLIKALNL